MTTVTSKMKHWMKVKVDKRLQKKKKRTENYKLKRNCRKKRVREFCPQILYAICPRKE